MQPDGSKHSSFSVPNNRNGAKLIVDRVTSVLQSLDIPQVVIGMEATSVYGDNLMRFFRESGSLGRFDRRLHMLNPKQVKKFRDSYSELPKNDYVDSFVIADHLRFGRINKEVYMDDYKYQALKMYTRARHQTVQDLTREKQRFLNVLFISFSGLAQEKIFSDKFPMSLRILFVSTAKTTLKIRKELRKLFSVLLRILTARRRSLQIPPSKCSPFL